MLSSQVAWANNVEMSIESVGRTCFNADVMFYVLCFARCAPNIWMESHKRVLEKSLDQKASPECQNKDSTSCLTPTIIDINAFRRLGPGNMLHGCRVDPWAQDRKHDPWMQSVNPCITCTKQGGTEQKIMRWLLWCSRSCGTCCVRRWVRWWRWSCACVYHGAEQLDCDSVFGPPPFVLVVIDPDFVVTGIDVKSEPSHKPGLARVIAILRLQMPKWLMAGQIKLKKLEAKWTHERL